MTDRPTNHPTNQPTRHGQGHREVTLPMIYLENVEKRMVENLLLEELL